MKKLLGIMISAFIFTQYAFGLEQPNEFDCFGEGIHVHYTASNIVGEQLFSVDLSGKVVDSYGDQIQTQSTTFGTEVSVILDYIPDFKTSLATLVLPNINLPQGAKSLTFNTVVGLTDSRTSIAGPSIVQGVLDYNSFVNVSCQARFIQS